MGRRAAPYTVYPDPRTGLAWLNTAIKGKRARKPLGLVFATDDGGGQEHERRLATKAAEVYAALVPGRSLTNEPTARVQTASTLRELLSAWLVEDGRTYPRQREAVDHARGPLGEVRRGRLPRLRGQGPDATLEGRQADAARETGRR